MKKCYSLLIAASVLLGTSCSSKKEDGGMSEKAKKNLESHRAISKAFETKDFSKIGDYMAADAVDYAGEMGPVKGLDSIRASFQKMSDMMTDNKHETIKELADDEHVMAWMRFSGTCNMDIPAMGMKKGQKISTEAIEVSQFKDGKVIAHWTFMQPGEVMKMMGMGNGQMPPAGDMKPAAPANDTTSK